MSAPIRTPDQFLAASAGLMEAIFALDHRSATEPCFVAIEKLAPCANPQFPAADAGQHVAGTVSPGCSLPVGYAIEGLLLAPVEVGKSVRVARTARNGVPVEGYFQSSKVTAVTPEGFDTLNSRYRLTRLPVGGAAQAGGSN